MTSIFLATHSPDEESFGVLMPSLCRSGDESSSTLVNLCGSDGSPCRRCDAAGASEGGSSVVCHREILSRSRWISGY